MRFGIVVVFVFAFVQNQALADVTIYTNRTQWQATAGSWLFIGFTGFPSNTNITNQYAAQGVLFTDGNDHIQNSPSWSDGSGLLSTEFISPYGGRARLQFPELRSDIAVDFTGGLLVELYSRGQLIYTSDHFNDAFTPFVGLHSTIPFDRAILYDGYDPVVAIDNLYFGPPVPTPGTIATLVAGAMIPRRRRIE